MKKNQSYMLDMLHQLYRSEILTLDEVAQIFDSYCIGDEQNASFLEGFVSGEINSEFDKEDLEEMRLP